MFFPPILLALLTIDGTRPLYLLGAGEPFTIQAHSQLTGSGPSGTPDTCDEDVSRGLPICPPSSSRRINNCGPPAPFSPPNVTCVSLLLPAQAVLNKIVQLVVSIPDGEEDLLFLMAVKRSGIPFVQPDTELWFESTDCSGDPWTFPIVSEFYSVSSGNALVNRAIGGIAPTG